MTALIGGGMLAMKNHDWVAAAMVGPPLAGLATVFVTGLIKEQQKNQNDKDSSASSTTQVKDDPEEDKE